MTDQFQVHKANGNRYLCLRNDFPWEWTYSLVCFLDNPKG